MMHATSSDLTSSRSAKSKDLHLTFLSVSIESHYIIRMTSSWSTLLTRKFPCRLPIMGAPMADVSGGLLAAETCRAGALGFLAAGHTVSLEQIDKQVALFRKHAPKDSPLSIGFIGHSTFASPASWDRFEAVLSRHNPSVVQFFAPALAARHDGKNNVQVAHEHDCLVLAQVGSVKEGKQALQAGADGIIAQGGEAGGHGLRRDVANGTLALAARLVTLASRDATIPVLAAGGIVDGRGVAAALALGCGGAVLGTRLWASNEALGHASFRKQLTLPSNEADQVVRTTVIDHIVNSYSETPWPYPYDSVGMLRNDTSQTWEGRPADLEAALASNSDSVASKYKKAIAEGDPNIAAVYSGQGVGEIDAIEPVFGIIQRIDEEAIVVVNALSRLRH